MANTLQTPPQPHEHEEEIEPSGEEFYGVHEEGEESFTCEICIEPTKKSTLAITSCAHQYCVDCTIKYIRVKIEDDNEAQIKCPAPSCTRMLDPVACAPLVGPATFVRWCDVLCRSALSGTDSSYCPYADCSELLLSDCARESTRLRWGPKKQINNTKTNNKSQCPMCKRWFCSECKKAWHAGFGCDDVPTDRADVAFGTLAEAMTWKRCPDCGHFVEHTGGCRLVRCRCGICFCYKCGKKAVNGGWCNCDRSCERCCALCCIRFFIILAILMLPLFLLLHNHKHHK